MTNKLMILERLVRLLFDSNHKNTFIPVFWGQSLFILLDETSLKLNVDPRATLGRTRKGKNKIMHSTCEGRVI